MDDEIPVEVMEEILDSIYRGQKIMACKKYRELRGCSLFDAKQFVDQLTEKLQAESPEKFVAQSNSGCAGLLLLALTLSASLVGCLRL